MKSETRRRKLAELWGDEELLELVPKNLTPEEQAEQDEVMREAEAVILATTTGEYFHETECKGCGRPFLSTYGKVTCCSKRCLKRVIESLGFDWDSNKSMEERWRPAWVTEILNAGPRRNPKTGKVIESPKDYQDRVNRLLSDYPVPLIVPAEALAALRNLDSLESHSELPQPLSDQS